MIAADPSRSAWASSADQRTTGPASATKTSGSSAPVDRADRAAAASMTTAASATAIAPSRTTTGRSVAGRPLDESRVMTTNPQSGHRRVKGCGLMMCPHIQTPDTEVDGCARRILPPVDSPERTRG